MDPFDKLLPKERLLESGPPAVIEWDIPQTISELAYLTHNHFRYYGKFPSTIPRKLLRSFPPKKETWVLDNFSGSGTTLVEAKLAGFHSLGIDVSPIATLATKVKTQHVDLRRVQSLLRGVVSHARRRTSVLDAQQQDSRIRSKWFSPSCIAQLDALRSELNKLPASKEREFLVLAFLAIIRRVSRAYDGEVRPHINPEKREREPVEAFEKKIDDMLIRARDFQALTSEDTQAVAVTRDNRQLASCDEISNRPIGMTISHPPYLNCFDYIPVYKLEFEWATGLPELGDWDYESLRHSELRSWPATDFSLFQAYFDGLQQAYRAVAQVCDRGSKCCIVIGDCTIKGKVVPVLDKMIEIGSSVGFTLEKMILRTTHYGIGKYAYATRADYHGKKAEKRDGVIVFSRR